jgi:hypothetical protein
MLLAEIEQARDAMTPDQLEVCNMVLDEYSDVEIITEDGRPIREVIEDLRVVRELLGRENGRLRRIERRFYVRH